MAPRRCHTTRSPSRRASSFETPILSFKTGYRWASQGAGTRPLVGCLSLVPGVTRRKGSMDRRHLIPMAPPNVQLSAERSAGVLTALRSQRQSLISCAARLGRSDPTATGAAGQPSTASLGGGGALPGLAISAAAQPTFCAPRVSHKWVDTMQISAVDAYSSSAAM